MTHPLPSNLRKEDLKGLRFDLSVLSGEEMSERLHGILSRMTEGFQLIGSDYRFQYFNEAARRTFAEQGMNPDELMNRHIFEEVFPAEREKPWAIELRRAMVERVCTEVEIFFEPWQHWFAARFNPAFDGGVSVYFQDITDCRRSEALLVEQQQLMGNIARGQSLSAILTDLCVAVSRLNPRARACVLLADEQRKNFAGSITPDLESAFGAALHDVPINELCIGTCGEAIYSRQPVLCADVTKDERWSKTWRDVCLSCGILAGYSQPILGSDGVPLASFFLCFGEPHTPDTWELQLAAFGAHLASIAIERCRTEETLRAQEQEAKRAREYAEATLRTSPVPLLVLERDFHVTTANEAFYETFHVHAAETEGRLVYELGNGQWNIPKLRELLESILPHHTVFRHFEVTHDFEFIGRRTMLLNARRMENEPEMPERVVLVIEDITERKAIQERLHLFTQELEAQVEARTQELVQSQNRLRAMATELNLAEQRERQRLAMELHDHLQQTLVLGRLILGQGKRASAAAPESFEVMNKMDAILTEALTYTRIVVADLSPPVLRDHGLGASLKWLGQHMQKRQLSVTVTVPQQEDFKLPEDQAFLLFQSVRELLINASKHAGTGEAEVQLERDDGQLRIQVRDHGVGFDPVMAHLAETAGGGISSKFGLFSIRERMRALGGSFELTSAPGNGTTAMLVMPLPRAIDETGRRAGTSETARTVRSEQSPLKIRVPIRVLLVDDHPMMRQGLRSIVTAYDHLQVVGEAGDGVEAVELAQRLQPDVVVMDINMPKMDGIEATRQIKAKQPTLVVIGLSVNQSTETENKMKAAGAFHYLTKESAVDALCHAIEQAVSYKKCSSV